MPAYDARRRGKVPCMLHKFASGVVWVDDPSLSSGPESETALSLHGVWVMPAMCIAYRGDPKREEFRLS